MLWYFLEAAVGVLILLYWLGLPEIDWDKLPADKREVLIEEMFSS